MMDILFPIFILAIVVMILGFVIRSILRPQKKHRSRIDRDSAAGSMAAVSSADEYSHLGSFDTDTPTRDDFGGGADFSGAGSGGSYNETDAGGGSFDASDSGAGDSGFDGGGGDGGGGNGGGGNGGGGNGGGGE